MMVIFCFIYLLAVEYILAQRSKGEILFFRRGYTDTSREITEDEEAPNAITTVSVRVYKKVETKAPADNQSNIFDALKKQTAVFHWDGISYSINTKDREKKKKKNSERSGWLGKAWDINRASSKQATNI
ncbi:hypothetical protein F4779DRAFT_587815, partial [Xylariaceae sp. FL0662B]